VSARRDGSGPLVEAAAALEEELRQLDDAAAEASRLPLTSRKNLERTVERIQEIGWLEERCGARLSAVVQAVAALQERQRAVLEGLAARAEELQQRRASLDALLGEYRSLGEQARALTAAAREVAAVPEPRDPVAVRTALGELGGRVEALAAAAERVSQDAREQRFEDVSQEAHGLRQALLAMRNRLGLAARA
jgi:chromosome segregation ATPase